MEKPRPRRGRVGEVESGMSLHQNASPQLCTSVSPVCVVIPQKNLCPAARKRLTSSLVGMEK